MLRKFENWFDNRQIKSDDMQKGNLLHSFCTDFSFVACDKTTFWYKIEFHSGTISVHILFDDDKRLYIKFSFCLTKVNLHRRTKIIMKLSFEFQWLFSHRQSKNITGVNSPYRLTWWPKQWLKKIYKMSFHYRRKVKTLSNLNFIPLSFISSLLLWSKWWIFSVSTYIKPESLRSRRCPKSVCLPQRSLI